MSEATDPVNVIYKIQREIKTQLESLVQTLANGGVDSMEEYKYIIGKIHGVDMINQELSNLLEPKEPDKDDQTTSHALDAKYENQDQEATNKPSQTNLEKLPDPTGWRILVMPFQVKEETKGGIIIAQETLDRARAAVQVGYVLKMGPLCYGDKERYPTGPWCKEKDWVIFARYAGSRMEIDGGEIRMLNDDEVLGTIDSPEDILHAM